MAYAAYRESFGAIATASSPPLRAGLDWAVLDVTVPSRDALRVRRALVNYPQVGVLRCIPQLEEQRARLEIRLPAHLAQDVMQRLILSAQRRDGAADFLAPPSAAAWAEP